MRAFNHSDRGEVPADHFGRSGHTDRQHQVQPSGELRAIYLFNPPVYRGLDILRETRISIVAIGSLITSPVTTMEVYCMGTSGWSAEHASWITPDFVASTSSCAMGMPITELIMAVPDSCMRRQVTDGDIVPFICDRRRASWYVQLCLFRIPSVLKLQEQLSLPSGCSAVMRSIYSCVRAFLFGLPLPDSVVSVVRNTAECE